MKDLLKQGVGEYKYWQERGNTMIGQQLSKEKNFPQTPKTKGNLNNL
jgi:hypothetical protein